MNALRGAIVVIIALVIGVVVLARGLDEPEAADAPVEATGTTEATTTTETVPAPAPAPAADPAPAPADAPAPAPTPTPAPAAEEADLPPAAPGDMFDDNTPAVSPTHARNEVRLLVANGTSVCGAAGRLATSLSAQGFNVLPAVNADNPADASFIYYVEQYGADASVVANLLQVDPAQVLPMPASPATAPGDSHVLIHIGADDLAQPNC